MLYFAIERKMVRILGLSCKSQNSFSLEVAQRAAIQDFLPEFVGKDNRLELDTVEVDLRDRVIVPLPVQARLIG